MPSCQFLFLFIFWLRLPSRPSRWPPRGRSPPWPGPWRTLSWIIRVWTFPWPSQTPSPTRPPAPVAQLSCSHSCHRHLLFAWGYFICNYYLYQCDFNIWIFYRFCFMKMTRLWPAARLTSSLWSSLRCQMNRLAWRTISGHSQCLGDTQWGPRLKVSLIFFRRFSL